MISHWIIAVVCCAIVLTSVECFVDFIEWGRTRSFLKSSNKNRPKVIHDRVTNFIAKCSSLEFARDFQCNRIIKVVVSCAAGQSQKIISRDCSLWQSRSNRYQFGYLLINLRHLNSPPRQRTIHGDRIQRIFSIGSIPRLVPLQCQIHTIQYPSSSSSVHHFPFFKERNRKRRCAEPPGPSMKVAAFRNEPCRLQLPGLVAQGAGFTWIRSVALEVAPRQIGGSDVVRR